MPLTISKVPTVKLGAVAAAVAAVFVVACSSSTSSPTPTSIPSPTATPTRATANTPAPPPTPEPLADIVARVASGVVLVAAGRGTGSGVIFSIDSSGAALVLTNQHVIDGAPSIEVVVDGSQVFPATVLGSDAGRDLAVLSICCSDGFTEVSLAAADAVRLGEPVWALGFPLGVPGLRVTQGIISGNYFNSDIDRYEIQTDAAINSGNSGGPLINGRGEIVGLTTYVLRDAPGAATIESFGFAVSIETLAAAVDALKRGEYVTAPTPTPHPSAPDGTFTSSAFGYQIDLPDGWLIDDSDPEEVTMWSAAFGAFIKVQVFAIPVTVLNVKEYLKDSPFVPNEVWANFEVESESTIFRDPVDNFGPVDGVEFAYTFELNSARRRGLTHLFVNPGLLFRIYLLSEAALWESPRYDGFEIEMRAGLISFRPPS